MTKSVPPNDPAPIRTLRRFLSRVRLRVVLARLLRRTSLVLSGAVATFVIASLPTIMASFGFAPPVVSLDVATSLSFAVLTLGVVVVLTWTLVSIPPIDAVARLADRSLGFDEKLATALEFHDEASAVQRALAADASASVANVDVRRTVVIPFARVSTTIASMVIGAVVLYIALGSIENPAEERTTRAAANERFEEQAQDVDVDTLRDLAAAAREDAERRNDPYLAAVAEAIERLSVDVEQGQLVPEAASAELERLLSHLEQAYGSDSDMVSDLLTQNGADDLAEADRSQEWNADDDVAPGELSQGAPADDPAIAARDRDGAASRRMEGAVPETLEGSPSRSYFDVSTARLAQQELERRDMARAQTDRPVGGDPGGAGDGASIEAGFGVQSPDAEDGDLAEWEAESLEDFALPSDEKASRRITIDAPPDEEFRDVAVVEVVPGDWRWSEEALSSTTRLSLQHRAVASRYFSPDTTVDDAESHE